MSSAFKARSNGVLSNRVQARFHVVENTGPVEHVHDGVRYTVEILTVTPEIAQEWLDVNIRNRPLSKTGVSKLREQIETGKWLFNGESIIFSEDGFLLDGQHRLRAVVDTGKSVVMLTIKGIDDKAFATIDRGLVRTYANVLSIEGYKSTSLLASAARLLWRHEGGKGLANAYYDPDSVDMLAFIELRPELTESVKVGHNLRHVASSTMIAFCHYLFTQQNGSLAEKFFEGLDTGAGLVVGDPVLLLRERLFSMNSTKGKLEPIEVAAIFFKAWNMAKEGRTGRQLHWRSGGESPEPFPIID